MPGQRTDLRTIRDRLQRNTWQTLGRQRELDMLLRCLDEDAPLVVHVHGASGIGKSALLGTFAAQARGRGAHVVTLECAAIEPTPAGFLRSLSEVLSHDVKTAEEAGEALAGGGRGVALLLDQYEVLTLLDVWMRQSFVPALPDSVRIILGSRLAPAAHWITAPDWYGLFRPLQLEPLDDETARALVGRAGVNGEAAQRVVEFAHGHPLALKMASTLASGTELHRGAPLVAVLHHLARLYLGEIENEDVREVLRASCVVRRITHPLIAAVGPDARTSDLMARLADIPFIEVDDGGLVMHDAIREAVAADFEAGDPMGFRAARRSAWHHLRAAAKGAQGGELWRYTADLIYLLRNPVVRDAFFPRETAPLAVEPARPEHGQAIVRIASLHEPPEGSQVLERWWTHVPQVFSVVLHPGGEVAGFYALFDPTKVPEELVLADPLARQWWSHARETRRPHGHTALFLRRWLSGADGERPSLVQASAWLDIKRRYMELRPRLRSVYLGLADPAPYAEVASQLGFRMLPGSGASMGTVSYSTAMLDMGPASVDGWLSWLLDTELGSDSDDILDLGGRALRLEDGAVPLTRLEFELMRYLWLRQGAAVSRQDLLTDVWGLNFDGGSNVVDTVVATLRRKLGKRAGVIGTVRGYGYVCRETRSVGHRSS